MTEEKKKRGRPRKIDAPKGGYTVAPLKEYDSEKLYTAAAEAVTAYVKEKEYQPSNLEKMVEVLQDVELTKNAIAKLKKTSSPEPPYPSNWNELGKIDKLQWLSANRKK